MTAQFYSDNISGVAPPILKAIEAANAGPQPSYGADAFSARAAQRIRDTFEAPEAAVVFCATGTAANAIALAALTPPWGCVYCHPEAHIETDECGAPEFFSGGAKLTLLPDAEGKISPDAVRRLTRPGAHDVHNVQPAALSLTQCTERGRVYTVDETKALCDAAKANGLRVHMDGARFANALAALGVTPAEATWKAGVDVLCLGATKNGAMAAEAIVAFDPALAETMELRRKRAGHLISKMRFVAAQMEAYLSDDLWLAHARHANAQALRLAEGLAAVPGCRLADPCQANEVFVEMPKALSAALADAGYGFGVWRAGESADLARLVCAFDTAPADVDAFVAAARSFAEGA
jgi:threonine aldolase